jgi:hypothetical protein
MGITRCHHGGALGDAHVGLPQPHAVLSGQPGQPLDRGDITGTTEFDPLLT